MIALSLRRHIWHDGSHAAASELNGPSDQHLTRTTRRLAARCAAPGAAWAAALVWLVRLPSFFFLGQSSSSLVSRELSALLGTMPHLLLFPVVAVLPAPRWARQAAYGWLVIDVATDVMALNGVPKTTYLALRYGGHVAAAL